MFGHQDTANDDGQVTASAPPTDNNLTNDAPSAPAVDATVQPVANDAADSSIAAGNSAGDYIVTDPATPQTAVSDASSADTTPAHDTPAGDPDLLNLKQQALQQLTPLVGHLDQSPEERFRTTMMMIQAADNKSLLQDAFTAAQAIPDEKVRAQALLDVVNEINYFTQHDQAA